MMSRSVWSNDWREPEAKSYYQPKGNPSIQWEVTFCHPDYMQMRCVKHSYPATVGTLMTFTREEVDLFMELAELPK